LARPHSTVDQMIEIHTGDLSRPYRTLREIRVRVPQQNMGDRKPTPEDVDSKLRMEARSMGANAVIHVEYRWRHPLGAFKALDGKGLAVVLSELGKARGTGDGVRQRLEPHVQTASVPPPIGYTSIGAIIEERAVRGRAAACVVDPGPARAYGLREGDVVTTVEGSAAESAADIAAALAMPVTEGQVRLLVERIGGRRALEIPPHTVGAPDHPSP
jgi:hypothetical protein